MSSVIKISDIDCLKSNKLVLIDDEMNKVCLGIKTNKFYSKVDFKFKVLNYKNIFFGVLLLKLDNNFLHCYINLNNLEYKKLLKKLLISDCFNLFTFDNSDYNRVKKINKVYLITNNLSYSFLLNVPQTLYNKLDFNINDVIYKLDKLYSPELLWNIWK